MTDATQPTSAPHHDTEGGGLPLHRMLAALRRQGLWIAGCTVLVLGATAWLTFRAEPVFQAQASLRIEERPGGGTGEMISQFSAPPTIETEVEILRSRSVAEDVVDALGLNVSLLSPRRTPRGAVLRRVSGAPAADRGLFAVRRTPGQFEITAPGGARATGAYGTPLRFAGMDLEVEAPSGEGPRDVTFLVTDPSVTAEALRAGLRVTRPQANARLVVVAYEATDPSLTRDVVNAVAQAYIWRRNQIQKQQAHTTVRFLNEQMSGIGAQLREAEGALESFRRTNLVMDPATQSSDEMRRLTDLRARREELEFRRTALRDLLARATQPGDSVGWAAMASTPALAGNASISDLLQQLTALETERGRLTDWRTSEDPDMRSIQRTIDAQSRRLRLLAGQQLAALEEQARQQDSVLATLDASIQRIPRTELQYVRLRRQVDLMSQLHTMLHTRLKEAEIAEAVEAANIQIVDPAVLPAAPIRPRTTANLVFGLLAGVLLGLIVALARELSDTVVRSREEVAQITNLPVLASIPRQPLTNGNGRDPAHRIEGRLVTRHAPRSPAAEAYRALRTNIAFSILPKDRPIGALVVTSAEPQAGKSTTAVNLAVALAEQGQRVLLLEADQRRPILHRVLHVSRVPGLTDLLAARAGFDEVRQRIVLPEHATGALDFIPGGTTVPNPAELAGSAPMRALLADLAKRYDALVLDTPPMSLVTDAAVAGAGADGVILVARMGATHKEALRRAVEELRAIGAPIVGMVLTDVRRSEDRYGQYSGQYYGKAYDDNDAAP